MFISVKQKIEFGMGTLLLILGPAMTLGLISAYGPIMFRFFDGYMFCSFTGIAFIYSSTEENPFARAIARCLAAFCITVGILSTILMWRFTT